MRSQELMEKYEVLKKLAKRPCRSNHFLYFVVANLMELERAIQETLASEKPEESSLNFLSEQRELVEACSSGDRNPDGSYNIPEDKKVEFEEKLQALHAKYPGVEESIKKTEKAHLDKLESAKINLTRINSRKLPHDFMTAEEVLILGDLVELKP